MPTHFTHFLSSNDAETARKKLKRSGVQSKVQIGRAFVRDRNRDSRTILPSDVRHKVRKQGLDGSLTLSADAQRGLSERTLAVAAKDVQSKNFIYNFSTFQ